MALSKTVDLGKLINVPAHIGYHLSRRLAVGSWIIGGLTLDIDVAMEYVNRGGVARLTKVWALPNGDLVREHPAEYGRFEAYRAYELPPIPGAL